MMDIAVDDALGIVRCVSVGTTSLAEAEAFCRKAESLQDRMRARRGSCLILVDSTRTAVNSQEVAAYFADHSARRFRPGDRTAIVIGSALARMQSQRVTDRSGHAYFTSEDAALAWLLADTAD